MPLPLAAPVIGRFAHTFATMSPSGVCIGISALSYKRVTLCTASQSTSVSEAVRTVVGPARYSPLAVYSCTSRAHLSTALP